MHSLALLENSSTLGLDYGTGHHVPVSAKRDVKMSLMGVSLSSTAEIGKAGRSLEMTGNK